jgi:hypothetical protein
MATIPNSQKTFSVNEGVNTTYGGSAAMKALSQWYTMQDITDTVRPYQVYTALLMQNGEDNEETLESGDALTIGQTYLIENGSDDPGDFLNVGAPSNDEGTLFVATGETPTKWGKTTLAYNTGAPVVTVLENTIGNVWFKYSAVGEYVMGSADLFTEGKTWFAQPLYTNVLDEASMSYSGSNELGIVSLQDGSGTDSVLDKGVSIEIRVYN